MPKRHRVGKSQASEARLSELEAFYASLPDDVLDSCDEHESPLCDDSDVAERLAFALSGMMRENESRKRAIPDRSSERSRSDNFGHVCVVKPSREYKRQLPTTKLDTRTVGEKLIDKFTKLVESSIYFDWRFINWDSVEKARQACESSD